MAATSPSQVIVTDGRTAFLRKNESMTFLEKFKGVIVMIFQVPAIFLVGFWDGVIFFYVQPALVETPDAPS